MLTSQKRRRRLVELQRKKRGSVEQAGFQKEEGGGAQKNSQKDRGPSDDYDRASVGCGVSKWDFGPSSCFSWSLSIAYELVQSQRLNELASRDRKTTMTRTKESAFPLVLSSPWQRASRLLADGSGPSRSCLALFGSQPRRVSQVGMIVSNLQQRTAIVSAVKHRSGPDYRPLASKTAPRWL